MMANDMTREKMLAQMTGWNGIDALSNSKPLPPIAPAHIASDDVCKSLAILHQNAMTRPVLDWLQANTSYAPPPPRSGTLEETALLGARHHERMQFGEDIMVAVCRGYALLNPEPPQNQAFTPPTGDLDNDPIFNDGFRIG